MATATPLTSGMGRRNIAKLESIGHADTFVHGSNTAATELGQLFLGPCALETKFANNHAVKVWFIGDENITWPDLCGHDRNRTETEQQFHINDLREYEMHATVQLNNLLVDENWPVGHRHRSHSNRFVVIV